MDYEDGLHERLLTAAELAAVDPMMQSVMQVSEPADQRELLAQHFQGRLNELLNLQETSEGLLDLAKRLSVALGVDLPAEANGKLTELLWSSAKPVLDRERLTNLRPLTPISDMALYTNARDEPRIDLELERELATSDSVDILVSFIKMSGLRLLEPQLRKLADRQVQVRLITTTYMGATDKKAIDRLVNELGVKVRIDLSPNSNRLHAKAWKFNRASGYSTAYVGSSNMSRAALTSGSEWNVRLAEVKAPGLFEKFRATFETYWEAPAYIEYSTDVHGSALQESLDRQSAGKFAPSFMLSGLEVTAKPHQTQMLEDLRVQREVFGHSHNLVVAATGTGKTVLAALDYKRLIKSGNARPTLLFVAHRKEILTQALLTFRQVLGDANFGELLVDGQRPSSWTHVFASIQSLNSGIVEQLGELHFQHLIVDEFHHAEAKSYKKLFEAFSAEQVVGLTATPERSDGVSEIWTSYFGGRIASELRLWDAINRDLLTPFHYFGVGEDLDYGQLPWARGRYDSTALSNLITSNSLRNKRVLRELESKVADPSSMRALVFCVSVAHAQQVARDFTAMGLETVPVTAETENRASVIQKLSAGEIQAIATVDVFNEGVDIPEVDTIILLRPTESPTLFLQQIGRGLRLCQGKADVLILDFIGAHRAEYRVDRKFEALSGRRRSEVLNNLRDGFPYLPSGSSIQLDDLGREHILNLMKAQVNPNWRQLAAEVASYATTSLAEYLNACGRDLYDVYKAADRNWVNLLSEAGIYAHPVSESDGKFLNRIPKLLHIDDLLRIEHLRAILEGTLPSWDDSTDAQKRLSSLVFWNLFNDALDPRSGERWSSIDEAFVALRNSKPFKFEALELLSVLHSKIEQVGEQFPLNFGQHPLLAHATYTRYELLGALGYGRLPGSSVYEDGKVRTISSAREGVYFVAEAKVDLFLVTLQKSQSLSPSIRYHDYAISNSIFHWESQSRTTPESPTGKRYINHRALGVDILMAVRATAKDGSGTQHFKLIGPVDYMNHEGSQPIKFWWHLQIPMDIKTFETAAAAKVS